LAAYKIVPQSAIVGELFGTEGEARADPQYMLGLRWESPELVIAATYGGGFGGAQGGALMRTPDFAALDDQV
jgi:hypothetical protein